MNKEDYKNVNVLADGGFDYQHALLDIPLREEWYFADGQKSSDTRFWDGVDEIIIDDYRRLYLMDGEDTMTLVLDYDQEEFVDRMMEKQDEDLEYGLDNEMLTREKWKERSWSEIEYETPDYLISGFIAALINLARHKRVYDYTHYSSLYKTSELDLSLREFNFRFRTPLRGLCETYLNYVRKNYFNYDALFVLDPDRKNIDKRILSDEIGYENTFFNHPVYSKLLDEQQLTDLKRYCKALRDLLRKEIGEDVEVAAPKASASVPNQPATKKEYCKYIKKEAFPTEYYTLDEFEKMMGEKSKDDALHFCRFLKQNDRRLLDFTIDNETKKAIHEYLMTHFPEMRTYTYQNFSKYFNCNTKPIK